MNTEKRIKSRTMFSVLLTAVLLISVTGSALADHGDATLAGSYFEIDNNANLKVDHDTPPSLDWANVQDIRANDTPSGQNDNSYSGGAKEDDACPGTTTGSIPNNKSDLLTFGAYVESEVGGPGYLNLFWTRVQEPSGTTLMDFELNQSNEDCGNGVNPVRTEGDLLIEYRIEQGGAVASIKVREWTGSAWGEAVDLTSLVPQQAAGTINSSSIPFEYSDELITSGSVSPRTFGEAQLDLDFIFDEGKCESFGSAFLKSRASDSFTSQLKDYIAPVPVNITNCGMVIIRKETNPEEDPNVTSFGFTKSFDTDPATTNEFSLLDDGAEPFNNVLFGTGYTVVEDNIPSGWEFESLDCSASTGVTPNITGATVTFDIDNAADILDCTYTNRAKGTIIVEKIKNDNGESQAFSFTSNTLTPFSLTPTGTGAAGKDSITFADLDTGIYDVAETVPAGWNLKSATCDDGSNPGAIGLDPGETVTCTFTNERERGAILVTKTRKHAASGPGDHPHAGVTFTVNGVTGVTNGSGQICFGGLLFGTYNVTETLPSGYVPDGPLTKSVAVSAESTCGDGNEATVSFSNTPLTDVTVSVNSQVDGGTASTISCVNSNGDPVASGSTAANGDGSTTVTNLLPDIYTCTIVVDP